MADPVYDRFMAKAKRPKGQKEPKWIKAKVDGQTYDDMKVHLARTRESVQSFVGRAIEVQLRRPA